MDALVLIGVIRELDRRIRGGVLAEFRQDSEHRFRVVFVREDRGIPLVVSVHPERPWIGRAPRRGRRRPEPRTTAFAAAVRRSLHDLVVSRVDTLSGSRGVDVVLADGHRLVLELARHGANVIVVGPDGRVERAARQPRSARDRLAPGANYRPPAPPAGRLDPVSAPADRVDRAVEAAVGEGVDLERAVRRVLFGVGSASVRALIDDAVVEGATVGEALARRVRRLADGRDAPTEVGSGSDGALVPWTGADVPAERDVLAVVGRHHDRIDREAWAVDRAAGLRAVLRREIRRAERTVRKIEADRDSFDDADLARRQAEALLAGLDAADRDGDVVRVPDPYDARGGTISMTVPPGVPLPRAADDLFGRHRRAVRGRASAEDRLRNLRARLARWVELEHAWRRRGVEDVDAFEQALRDAGIPVGLAAARRARAVEAAAGARPRTAGVRVFADDEGVPILVGKTARDNHHLTFRIAQPEDFWFHALGVTGAHVVARNPERARRPGEATLRRAASLAAWFSESRTDAAVDVQWTRRKYVRRVRNGPPGAVVLKRFETVRVPPAPPDEHDDRA